MNEHLFKLKRDGKTVGYWKNENGFLLGSLNGKDFVFITAQNASGGLHLYGDDKESYIDFDTAHLFITKDKNGENIWRR